MKNIAIVCLLLVLATGCRTPTPPSPTIMDGTNRVSEIAVTRTWAELLSQKPLIEDPTAPCGERVAGPKEPFVAHVGIEAASCAPPHHPPGNKWYFVYCLVPNCRGGISGLFGGDPFGPLGLTVNEKGRLRGQARCDAEFALEGEDPQGALFVKSVAFAKPGEYEIRLTGRNGKVLAMRTIKCEGKPEQPWMPWGKPDMLRAKALTVAGGVSAVRVDVTNPWRPPEVPDWSGMLPLWVPDGALSGKPRRLRLPTLVSDRPDDGIKATLVGNVVVVETAEDMLFTGAERCFLTRWWVNGRPVQPDMRQEEVLMEMMGAQAMNTRRVEFQMAFDAGRIGAKCGDKVSLQLLYCPCGVARPYDGLVAAMRAQEALKPMTAVGRSLTLLSNRVEFTVHDQTGLPVSVTGAD